MNLTDAHKVRIDKYYLPITPELITISNSDNTEVSTMANGDFITVPAIDGPQKFSFDIRIYKNNYPFTFTEFWQDRNHKFWTDLLWNWKRWGDCLELVIERSTGEHMVERVMLQDYSYDEDANDMSDFTIHVTFINYKMHNNQELDVSVTHQLIADRQARGWKTGRGML